MPNHKVPFDRIKNYIEVENKNKACKLLTVENEYKGSTTEKLKLCCQCGEEFEIWWSHIKQYKKLHCNKCGNGRLRKRRFKTTYKEIELEISSLGAKLITNEEKYLYQVYEERKYPNTAKLVLLCCDCKVNTLTTNLRRIRERGKVWCHDCAMKRRSMTYKEVKHFIEIESKSRCKLISKEYHGVLEPLLMKCWCGKKFKKSFHNFKNLALMSCGKHISSTGEQRIIDYCEDNSIKYEPQYTFEDCRNEKVLPFDVAVFNKNKLHMLIEYHGEQHYEPKGFGLKNEDDKMYKFMMQQIRDSIKEEYCKTNKIKLLIIPYTKRDKIEEILDEALSHLKCIPNYTVEYEKPDWEQLSLFC